MAFTLPELPYARDALVPHISAETLEYHHGKHHQAYVTNLNNLIKGTALEEKSLEEIVRTTEGPIFNNAAQVWNHTFYFRSLAPKAGGMPKGQVLSAINASFGDYARFKQELTSAATSLFGSGWAWLVKEKGTAALKIVQTSNAGCPIQTGLVPLVACDVWEHAYYIDYRNARPKYVEAFFQLINWEFAEQNLIA